MSQTFAADNDSLQECSKLLHHDPIEVHFMDLTDARQQSLSTAAFKVVGLEPGKHGGSRIVVESKATAVGLFRYFQYSEMEKDFTPGGADGAQDLRLFPRILGSKEAKFFGYEEVAPGKVMVPDIIELNGAIDRYNQGLAVDDPRRINIKFWATDDAFVPNRDYVKRFAERGELPIANKNRQFYHDISTHAMSGFFEDNDLIANLRKSTNLWFEFYEKILSDGQDTNKLAALKEMDETVMKELGHEIDQLGAKFGDFKAPGIRGADRFGSKSLDQLEATTRSPEDFFANLLNRNPFKSSALMSDWKAFVQEQRRLHPNKLVAAISTRATEWDRIKTKWILWNSDPNKRIGKYEKNPYSKPFAHRLERLRELASKYDESH